MTETERVEMPERVYREEARLFHAKDGHVTNYDRLFGTPEMAACTIREALRAAKKCYWTPCHDCLIEDTLCGDFGDIASYLREEVDDD